MYPPGHYGVALVTYAPIAFVLFALGFRELALIGGDGVMVLAMVPDYDLRVPGITHRGPTHTVWFAILVGGVLGIGGGLVGSSNGLLATGGPAVFAFLVGAVAILSHIAADALTPAGVRPFTPIQKQRYSYSLTTAKNPIANYGLFGLGVLVSVFVLVVGSAFNQYLSQL